EWCADWFDPAYYQRSPWKNPQGPASGRRKASRGGSWRHQIKIARVAARSRIPPEYRYSDYGVRGGILGATRDSSVGGSAIAGLNRLSYNMVPPGARRKRRPGCI